MTTESIKKTDAGQELKIVDVSDRNRRNGVGKSVAVLLVAALAFGLAFAAVVEGVHAPPGHIDEPPAADDGTPVIPWDKPPLLDDGGVDWGIKPTRLLE